MAESEIQRAVQLSSFTRSTIPFKYLGVPICSKRISQNECNILVDKMTARIKIWSTKHISFAGRAIFINSVLLTIHTYWSQILVLPKKVIVEIERICRSFLWKGSNSMTGAGAVAWEKVCHSKAEGGMGFLNISNWNKAALMKNIWTLATKKDNSWVKWIYSVYLNNGDCWSHKASIHISWYWRKLVEIKDEMLRNWDSRQIMVVEYKISEGYKKLQQPLERIHRCKQHNRDMLQQMKDWVGWKAQSTDLLTLIRCIGKSKRSRFRKQVFSAIIVGLVYFIWQQRNDKIWQENSRQMHIQELKWQIKTRITCVLPKKIEQEDRRWFEYL
ncbi:hypothetical protein CsatB_013613 [Cannabis sativa]